MELELPFVFLEVSCSPQVFMRVTSTLNEHGFLGETSMKHPSRMR